MLFDQVCEIMLITSYWLWVLVGSARGCVCLVLPMRATCPRGALRDAPVCFAYASHRVRVRCLFLGSLGHQFSTVHLKGPLVARSTAHVKVSKSPPVSHRAGTEYHTYRSDGSREIRQIFVVVVEAYVTVRVEKTIPPAITRCSFAFKELEIHFL